MGLNYLTAREILSCRTPAGLGRVITIGRLQQFLLPAQLAELQRDRRLAPGAWSDCRFGEYAEDFFRAAGASSISSLDASAYEGADVVHDMNLPLPPQLHNAYDLVIDGGSMEHVFRPDQALANTMRLTAVGGHLIIWTPANNQCGHGFYQFSPEFFFAALQARAGFALERVLLVECVYPEVSLVAPRRAYAVRDPREVRARVGALSRRPLMLLAHARKLEHLDAPLAITPQQSDYEAEWQGQSHAGATPAARLATAAAGRLKATGAGTLLVHHARGLASRRRFSLRNRRFFDPQ